MTHTIEVSIRTKKRCSTVVLCYSDTWLVADWRQHNAFAMKWTKGENEALVLCSEHRVSNEKCLESFCGCTIKNVLTHWIFIFVVVVAAFVVVNGKKNEREMESKRECSSQYGTRYGFVRVSNITHIWKFFLTIFRLLYCTRRISRVGF